MEQFDVDLIKHTQLRNIESCKDPEHAVIKMQPSPKNADGTLKQCGCGSEYADDGLFVKGFATLYTHLGAVKCQYSNLKCASGNCEIPYAEAAAEQGIYFSTTVTCAGDEIGWDFITDVLKKRTCFSAFCAEMSIKYQTNNPMAAPFMSTKTFISYFFGWLSNMNIDFRKEIDLECGYQPQILACDGIHIGVSIKHMKLENPITKNDVPTQLSPKHQLLQRTMIAQNETRAHLQYFCNKFLGKLKPRDVLSQQEEVCRREFLTAINTRADICNFVTMFLDKQVPNEMLMEMAKLLHMFSGDACMSSVFPFEGNPYITTACTAISTNNLQPHIMDKLQEYNKEVVCLLHPSQIHECVDAITCFMLCIISEIDKIHHDNRSAEQAQPIHGSYYPPGGIAYYFLPSGEQLCKMSDFTVNGTSSQPNYDDNPLVDPMCEKFSGVSYGGYGYMFIWFCPKHGHTYGFHLPHQQS